MNKKFIQFFIPMKPPTVTQQKKRISKSKSGKLCFYDTPELKSARSKLTDSLAKFVPEHKFETPVRLCVKWCFPITRGHRDGEYKSSKPDTDNLQKMLKDIMTALGFWTDDALVCSEIIEKFYAKMPGLFVMIEEL